MSDYTYFFSEEPPQELAEAIRDLSKLQRWVKPPRSKTELHYALSILHIHHQPMREVIESEIALRNHEELVSNLSRPKAWWEKPFGIVALGVLAGLILLLIGSLF